MGVKGVITIPCKIEESVYLSLYNLWRVSQEIVAVTARRVYWRGSRHRLVYILCIDHRLEVGHQARILSP